MKNKIPCHSKTSNFSPVKISKTISEDSLDKDPKFDCPSNSAVSTHNL